MPYPHTFSLNFFFFFFLFLWTGWIDVSFFALPRDSVGKYLLRTYKWPTKPMYSTTYLQGWLVVPSMEVILLLPGKYSAVVAPLTLYEQVPVRVWYS